MIYLVEDDASIRELVVYALSNSGFNARGFDTPSAFWQAMEKETPVMVLLDIMLPEEDGLQILKKLRADGRTRRTPVIMLTAKGSEYDKVIGLEAGADDYIPKPFGMMELIARVKALLRRASDQPAPETYQVGCLTVCPQRHLVEVDGAAVTLTLKEYELLCALVNNRGIAMTREKLLSLVWGYDFFGDDRTLDTHIKLLRRNLKEYSRYIVTLRGVGYRFEKTN